MKTVDTKPHRTDRPLNIALLGYRSHPHVGGQGVYLKYLSRALKARGHKVDVLSGPPYPELDPDVDLIKIPSLNLYEHPKPSRALRWQHLKSWADIVEWWSKISGGFAEPYCFGRRVAKYLRTSDRRYDVIHDNQSLCYGLLTLQKLGFPIVSSIHHPITRDRALAIEEAPTWGHKVLVKRWYYFVHMQRKVAQNLHNITTVSYFSRRDIANQFGRPVEKTTVIANGVDTRCFRPDPAVNPIPFRLMTTTSSDQAIKGFGVLLEALALLRQDFPDIHLQVIGTLKKNGPNEKRMSELKLQDCVHFKNGLSHEEIASEYALSTVAVCPSLYEGFGLPAAEAMACGVPLVSTSGGALAEVVGDAGLQCTPGDAGALAAHIHKVLRQPELAKKLSEAGRLRVLKHFSWDRVAEQLEQYYRQQF